VGAAAITRLKRGNASVAHTRYAGNRIRDGRGLAYGGPSCFSHERAAFVKIGPQRTRYAALILLLALLACFAAAAFRFQIERHSRHVEIAMDYNDFIQLSRSFDYNPDAFLIALRRAGLTSLALSEELGANVGDSGNVNVLTGTQLLDAARLSRIADPTFANLLRGGGVRPDTIYLTIYDRATYDRYTRMLPLHFSPRSIRVLHATQPWIVALHTQIDYFNNISLGIPDDQLAMARRLGLEIVPRFQNDERFAAPEIQALFASLGGDRRVSTAIFFGLRNQVVGYPDHIDDTADVFKAHAFNFGSIEIYDDSQIQKGNDTLAKDIPGRTVRVQAIAKTELDKLTFEEVVARYVLGVRERNVRVVYLRPFPHQQGALSIEGTNVALVQAIADQLHDTGFTPGRASAIPLYRGNNVVLVGIAALAVPSIFVLLLGIFGWYRPWYAIAAFAATIVLYGGGVVAHHDMLARSIIALAGALLFAAAAFLVLAPAFNETPAESTRAQIVRSLRWTLIATGVALLGALVVVGLMSSPLAMEEIEKFRGVKLVLALPPVIALALYMFGGRFGTQGESARDVFETPVRAWHLLVLAIVATGGVLLVMRSGNQSDIAPTGFELALRHGLTAVLNVRPRFKEFLVGFPLLMLAPALAPVHRRAVGWLLALGIGVGIGDIIDTFSHLHTALLVSFLRIFNGFVIGALIGIVAIVVYRAIVRRRAIGAATSSETP
jgi:hypothetical protein